MQDLEGVRPFSLGEGEEGGGCPILKRLAHTLAMIRDTTKGTACMIRGWQVMTKGLGVMVQFPQQWQGLALQE